MTQQQRLDYLVGQFWQESAPSRPLTLPASVAEKRRILRSLMNTRMPAPLPEQVRQVQDEYLCARAAERGIVPLSALPTVAEALGSALPEGRLISLWQGDITLLAVDAIVNAANAQMLGCFVPMHQCIDNCIHTFAGVQLRQECARRMETLRSRFGGDYLQPTAQPMLTDAYNLPAKKVIHVVGPVVEGSLTPRHEAELADCYRNVLNLCAENGLKTVAFCCISTGVFRFPGDRAAEIAVDTVRHWLAGHAGQMERVVFNVFQDNDLARYRAILS